LWATDLPTCNDTGSAASSAGSASASAGACALPQNTLLKRLDPRTGEEVAAIPLEGFSANITEVAFGAGSVWVSSGDYYPEPAGGKQPDDVVLRVDPRTKRVVDRIPVYTSSGLAFGHGSVWVTSATYGTVSRIDPETGEVAAKIEVGRGAVDIASDESSGAVWVAGLYLPEDYNGYDGSKHSQDNKLTRVDPATNRVVAEIPIRADSPDGGASSVAVGEGSVWVQSADGRLFEVDPATNEVTATVPLGDYSSHLAVYGGAVWATFQFSCEATSEASASASRPPSCTRSWRAYDQEHLVRVDPRTEQVVASDDIGLVSKVGYGRLVAGGGYVWFASGGGLARVTP
jgi:streptogramin lyase